MTGNTHRAECIDKLYALESSGWAFAWSSCAPLNAAARADELAQQPPAPRLIARFRKTPTRGLW